MSEPQTVASDDAFTQDEKPAVTNTSFEEWVGEGKKYANVEEMAKANMHAQPMIESLTRQVDELREELGRRVNFEQAIERLEARASQPSEQQTVSYENTTQEPQGLSKEDIESLLSERLNDSLSQLTARQQEEQNLKAVNDTLFEKFGDRTKDVVASKARELGVDAEFLKTMSAQQPKAALALFADSPSGNPPGREQSSVNTEAISQGGEDLSWDKLQEMRRKDPMRYFSPEIQQRVMKYAEEKFNSGKDPFTKENKPF